MPIPAGVTTALVHMDAPVSFIGEPGRLHVRITPSDSLVWEATGTPLANFFDAIAPDNGEPMEIELPHTDQPGFIDGVGNSVTDWFYSATIKYEKDGQIIHFPSRDFQIPTGQDDIDLALVPSGEAYTPSIAPTLPVTSIEGLTGAVTLADLDLELVDNTPDAGKPVSTAQAQAIALKLDATQKGAANGVAALDGDGNVQEVHIPDRLSDASLTTKIQDLSDVTGPLDGLTDVTAPSPTDGQALVWDAGTSRWVNETIAGGGGASALDDLTDVDTAGLADEDVLTYDAATST